MKLFKTPRTGIKSPVVTAEAQIVPPRPVTTQDAFFAVPAVEANSTGVAVALVEPQWINIVPSEQSLLKAGGFGKVYADTWSLGGESAQLVVVKTIKKKWGSTGREVDRSAREEATAMSRLDHTNVIKFFAFCQTPTSYMIVMNRGQGGDLLDHVIEKGPLSEQSARGYMKQVEAALDHCHARGVYHRDVKLDNFVFADSDCTHLQLIDFGLSKMVSADRTKDLKRYCGTEDYMAPEIFAEKGYNGAKVDAFASGCLAYMMVTRKAPFRQKDTKRQKWKAPANVSPSMVVFLQKLLASDPHERITPAKALVEPWLLATTQLTRTP